MCENCLEWDEAERSRLEKRILKLTNNKITKLFEEVGISYMVPMEEIIEEMRDEKEGSINLDILLSEAESKEILLQSLEDLEK